MLVVVEAPGDEHVDKVGERAQGGVEAHGFLVELAAVGHAGHAADLVLRKLLVFLLTVVVSAQALRNNNRSRKQTRKVLKKQRHHARIRVAVHQDLAECVVERAVRARRQTKNIEN